jgi:transcriptional regulator with XRE-family HTH domain
MRVISKIQEIRKSKNISQKEMAEMLHISQPGYQKIEQGVNVLSLDRFLDICSILKIESYNLVIPPVNIETTEKIQKSLLEGSFAFENIRRNAMAIRRILDDLTEKIKNGKIVLEAIPEELEFLENYLAIISKDSAVKGHDYMEIRNLINKID